MDHEVMMRLNSIDAKIHTTSINMDTLKSLSQATYVTKYDSQAEVAEIKKRLSELEGVEKKYDVAMEQNRLLLKMIQDVNARVEQLEKEKVTS